ncbi:MAG: diguanylate cyclase, partial [Arenimonas sp.]
MLNREACFDATRRLIARQGDSSGVLAAMILRIRRFREFNIRFGYAAGDQLVAAVAEQVMQALRPVDELIQVGSSDFAILLPGL